MRISALLILFVSTTVTSSSPAVLIPNKLEETLGFLHSLYQPNKFSLTAALDSLMPVLRAKHQLVSGFAEPFGWSQLVEFQAATSMALMYLRSIRPLTPSNNQPALDEFVAGLETIREEMKRVVDGTPGTVNDLSADLVNEIHGALVELKAVHSRITELLSKPVDGLSEFTRRNAHRFFETSSEVFEDWSLRRIEFGSVYELREVCKSAAGDADSLAQSAELYQLPATNTLGRELKRIIIRIRLYITKIQPAGSDSVTATTPMASMAERAGQLATSLSGKMGQTIMIISKVESLNEAEASTTQQLLNAIEVGKVKLQQSSLPDDLFMICSTMVSLVRLYANSVPGNRVSWMRVLVPEWDQLRLLAVQLLGPEHVSDVSEVVRTDFRNIMTEIRPVVADIVASDGQLGSRSRSFLALAAVAVDELSMRSMMLARAAIFDEHVITVVGILDDLHGTLPGVLGEGLKGFISRLRTIARHTRKLLKRQPMMTAVTTESSASSESYTTPEPREVPQASTYEPTTTDAARFELLNAGTESEEGEWVKSRSEARRDRKKLKDPSDSEGRPNSIGNDRVRNEKTTDKHIPTTVQRVGGLRNVPNPKTTQTSPTTHHTVRPTSPQTTQGPVITQHAETSTKTSERPITTNKPVSLTTEITTECFSTTQQAATSTMATERVSTTNQPVSVRTEQTRHSTTHQSVSVTTGSARTVGKTEGTDLTISSVVVSSTEFNRSGDDSTEMMDDASQEYVIQHILAPQPVAQIGARIRMLADTIGSIASEISVLATDASSSSLDEATSFNIDILCQQLNSTRIAIEQLRQMATGFEEFANQLPPVAYPVVCYAYPPALEEE